MIKSFDKDSLRMFRAELDLALKVVGQKHGVNLSLGTIRYEASTFRTKLEGRLISASMISGDKIYDSLTTVADDLGYGPDVLSDKDCGRTFFLGRKFYIILGAKRSSYKYPVFAKEKVTGKVFKFPLADVAMALGRKFKLSPIDQMEKEGRG